MLRITSILALIASLTLVACFGGGGGGSSDPRGVPTATPFAILPPPTIVSGEGLVTNNGGTATGEGTYVVQPGDSLSLIAANLGVSLEELIALNSDLADPASLEVGQVIRVPRTSDALSATPSAGEPPPAATATPTGPEEEEPTGDEQIYVVQDGDIAASIAATFGVTLEELADANNTTIDGLRELEIGQELIIPPPSQEPQPIVEEEPEPTATPEVIEEPPAEEPPPEEPVETPVEGEAP